MSADRSFGQTPGSQNFVVCVRVRGGGPGAETQSEDFLTSGKGIWALDTASNSLKATETHPSRSKRGGSSAGEANNTYEFKFDAVLPPTQTTAELFGSHIAPIVAAAVDGFNGTVFAYGQTGSGKTYTMSGTEAEPGVIPRAISEVFRIIAEDNAREFLVRVSYLELYNEQLKDLLANRPAPSSPIKGGRTHTTQADGQLRIVEEKGRVVIAGLQEEIVTSTKDVLSLIDRGQASRHVGATDWNEHSSRSHCVLQVTIESRDRDSTKAGKEVRISQLNLIDLAGSERAASQVERRKEGAFINKSLLTLGTVISKLTENTTANSSGTPTPANSNHIPYRDSKLTRILQTSLGGNARVAVICTMSALPEHAAEALSTLSFGKRCKLVVSNAKRGAIMDDKALLKRYRQELDELRKQLEAKEAMGISPNTSYADLHAEQEDQKKVIEALGAQKAETEKEVEAMTAKRSELRSQIDHLTRLILTGQRIQTDTDKDMQDSGSSGMLDVMQSPRRRKGRLTESMLSLGASPKVQEMVDVFGSTARISANGEVPARSSDSAGPSPSKSTNFRSSVVEGDLALLRRGLRDARDTHKSTEANQRATISSLEARNAALQAQILSQERELNEAEGAWLKLKAERDQYRDALEDALEQRDAFEIAADTEKEAKEHAQAELEAEASRYEERLEEEATRFQTRLDEEIRLLKLVGTFREASSSDGASMSALKEEVERLTRAKSDAENELDRYRKQMDTTVADTERARRDAEQAAERYRSEASELGRLRGDLEEFRSRTSALELELAQTRKRNGSSPSIDTSANSELARRRLALEEKERALSRREAALAEKERAPPPSPRPLPVPGQLSPGKTSRPLPSPSQSSSVGRTLSDPPSTVARGAELQQQNTKLTTQIRDLESRLAQAEADAMNALAAQSTGGRSSPSPTIVEKMEKLVELQLQVDEQTTKIESLTRELAEERAKKARPLPSIPMPGSPTRSPSKLSQDITSTWTKSSSEVGSSPSSRWPVPLAYNRTRTMTALAQTPLERPIPLRPSSMSPSLSMGAGAKPQRAGSMREWKKYESSSSLADAAAIEGTRKVGGGPGDPSALTVEDAVKAEREEIARLNAVIASQRTLMADLEASVEKWKTRLGAQQNIIDELVKQGENDDKLRKKASLLSMPGSPVKRPSSILAESPGPASPAPTTLNHLSDASNNPRPLPVPQAAPRDLPNPWQPSPAISEYSTAFAGSPLWGSSLSREQSLRSAAGSSWQENRPLGRQGSVKGLMIGQPYVGEYGVKNRGHEGAREGRLDDQSSLYGARYDVLAAHGSSKPSPIPIPEGGVEATAPSPGSQSPRKRRLTLEAEMAMLEGQPLVQRSKSKLLSSSPSTVGKQARPRTASKEIQALLNANGKRSAADWYI
ncbi:Kinesin-like protein kip2 [Tilletia horrida]|uniref:Kinesin-like protein kip2 n=1 Tax=Tilletia horrida TaxID=155126 RepID=A0AAN6GSG2_9BASI|nr:Kinesin-like protein kip2 [Tilletia horrida]KAK0569489.1 Kinesin-like protein kip2 [Tilletia horrida]